MAKLSDFRRNAQAIEEGEWQRVGDEFDDLEVKVRGFTTRYNDARNAKFRRAAVPFNGDTTRIPSKIAADIVTDCVIQHLFIDVRNLEDDNGPVTRERFTELLRDPDYQPLVNAVIVAASKVGQVRALEAEEAVGNSETPSAGT